MALGDGIFFGWFRWLYLLVKAVAWYAGTFSVCYYWPLFIQSLVAPPASSETQFIATVMLAPLGFLALGLTQGVVSLAYHAMILLAGIGIAWLLFPKNEGIPETFELVRAWLPVLLGIYVVGVGVGFWRQLERFSEE